MTEIRREYGQLRAHPSALAVDNLGEPVDPVVTTDAVLHGLEMTASELDCAQQQLAVARARHATRLKLTDQAAAELETRRGHRRIERTR